MKNNLKLVFIFTEPNVEHSKSLFFSYMPTKINAIFFYFLKVPPQEILTRDSVTVAVDAVVYYQISSPMSAVINVSDYAKSTKLLASTTLRTILGTKTLAEILSDRETIAVDILQHLDSATDPWGVKVRLSFYLTDICA